MDSVFEQVNSTLYRLDIPFDHLYTSVFLITGDTPLIVDSATTCEDVETRILPALQEMGVNGGRLLVTHRHGDHNGGTPFLLPAMPTLTPLRLADGESFESITALSLGGHTEDSMGYYDTRTKTLLLGDALQFYGVGKYGCSIVDATLYERTLDRLDALGAHALIPSHDFVGGAAAAIGEDAVIALLASARRIWGEIKAFILSYKENTDPFVIVRAWKETHPTLPPLPSITVRSVQKTV